MEGLIGDLMLHKSCEKNFLESPIQHKFSATAVYRKFLHTGRSRNVWEDKIDLTFQMSRKINNQKKFHAHRVRGPWSTPYFKSFSMDFQRAGATLGVLVAANLYKDFDAI